MLDVGSELVKLGSMASKCLRKSHFGSIWVCKRCEGSPAFENGPSHVHGWNRRFAYVTSPYPSRRRVHELHGRKMGIWHMPRLTTSVPQDWARRSRDCYFQFHFRVQQPISIASELRRYSSPFFRRLILHKGAASLVVDVRIW